MLDKASGIQFHSQLVKLSLKDRKRLKLFLAAIFKKEQQTLKSLHIIFCSDESLLSINKEFLKHNYYTDIITFNLGDKHNIEGEIYISLDRVKDNAVALQQNITTELHRVIFHGVLHLCGYKDKTTKEKNLMRKMEGKYLDLYFG